MRIHFSRHAKRRAKLYKIHQSKIELLLSDLKLTEGENIVIKELAGFEYPIKIVLSVEKDDATIITVYPLKKGIQQ
ncbi:MAG: hypothetical protein U5R06_16000 [candidate division KSB1 bacterium]|nr:hypothetical protein [candidate division KSB1 bacterium]